MPQAGRLRDMTGGFDVDDSAVIDENIVYIEGLVQVDHYLRSDAIQPGVIYLIWSDGGLSFNLPDALQTEGTIQRANGTTLATSTQATDRMVPGDEVTWGGAALGGFAVGTKYYVEKLSSGQVALHSTRDRALRGQSGTRINSGNNGIVSGTQRTITLAAGPRHQPKFGSVLENPIIFTEGSDARPQGQDNYNDSNNPSRFQSGGITFENMMWKSIVPNQDRSDFDIAPNARPTFINCRFECLQQYSHFASPHMQATNLIFDSNFYSENQNNRIIDIAARIPEPKGFTLQPSGNDLRVLGAFLEDFDTSDPSTALRMSNLSGIAGIEIDSFNPNGPNLSDPALALKVIFLIDPAGVIRKRTTGGSVFIYRSVRLSPGSAEISDLTRTIVDTTDAGHHDPGTKTGTGASGFNYELLSHSGISATDYTTFSNYEAITVSPFYRKKRQAFTIDIAPAVAGTVQNIGLELVRETYPNGTNFALSQTAPTTATTLEHIYEGFKRWEVASVANMTAFSRTDSVCTIEEGYLKFADNINVVLDIQATDLFAFNDATDTVTIKIGSTLTAGSNDLLGIQVGGTGAIRAGTGQTLPSTILFRTATGGNSVLRLTGLDTQAKTALFRANGELVGSVITGTTTATINATQDESSAGMVLASYRRGYIQQLLPLDLSAGGSFTRNLEPMFELRDFDDRGVFYSDRISSLSDFVFGQEPVPGSNPVVQRPACTVRVGNEQWQLRSLSSSYFEALWTEGGLRYLARGGQQINFFSFSSYLGAEFALPPGTKITRRATGDVSATILSTIYVREGEDLFVSEQANLQVQLNGIKSQDEFASAIWQGRVDIPNAATGSALAALRQVLAVTAGEAEVNGSTWSFKDGAGNVALTINVDPNGSRALP